MRTEKDIISKPDTEINIDGIKLLYQRKYYTYGEYGMFSSYSTKFYGYEPKIEKYKRFAFFGKDCERNYYKFMFELDVDIESEKNSKEEVRSAILKAYSNYLNIDKRRSEIDNGNIV